MNSYYFDDYKITELSYFEYKNLVKSFLTDDLQVLNKIFEKLYKDNVFTEKKPTAFDKLKCLLHIRSLILGEDVDLIYNDKNYKLNTQHIIENTHIEERDLTSENLAFKNFDTFFISDLTNELYKNLKSINLNGKKIDFSNFTLNQKEEILDNIPDLNFSQIVTDCGNYLTKSTIQVLDTKLSVYNGDVLYFLKNIFNTSLENLYDFEYILIKQLNLNTADFKNYSFTELKIFYNKIVKEFNAQKESSSSTGINLNQQ
tara:strand:+ start:1575 stop:2348 length:774 start_codon:yes stop_codon:yes gene_type:complete